MQLFVNLLAPAELARALDVGQLLPGKVLVDWEGYPGRYGPFSGTRCLPAAERIGTVFPSGRKRSAAATGEVARSASAVEFIEHLRLIAGVSGNLIITKVGKKGGTWGHWQIGLAYARERRRLSRAFPRERWGRAAFQGIRITRTPLARAKGMPPWHAPATS